MSNNAVYIDRDTGIEVYAAWGSDSGKVYVVLPSQVYVDPDEARRFASAILRAADVAEKRRSASRT